MIAGGLLYTTDYSTHAEERQELRRKLEALSQDDRERVEAFIDALLILQAGGGKILQFPQPPVRAEC
jgi:hypothetical protein